jgi:hypothetical protein
MNDLNLSVLKFYDDARLKAMNPLPITDIAYRLRPDVASYYLTPYKLLQMYGLQDYLLSADTQIRIMGASLSTWEHFYLTDLGTISTFGNVVSQLGAIAIKNYVSSFPEDFRANYDLVDKYFHAKSVQNFGNDWFGYDLEEPKYLDYVLGIKKQYPKMDEANKFFDEFEAALQINPETDVPNPRTMFTSRPTGIFTFSRIAPTLYAFPCYKVEESDEKCIPPSNVLRENNRFFLQDDPATEVQKYGFERREDGSEKYRTLAKRVYATKEQKIKVLPYINIYVSLGTRSDVDAEKYRYNSFAAIALARLLVGNGFKVAITAIRIGLHNTEEALKKHDYKYDSNDPFAAQVSKRQAANNSLYMGRFLVKDYNDLLDFNAALIYGGDPAFYRYDYFKVIHLAASSWYRKSDEGRGYSLQKEDEIETVLDRYNVNNIENETRVIFAGRFSKNKATDAVRTKLAQLRLLYGRGNNA